MTDELFDLVDEQDNIVGTTSKDEAHEKALPHRIGAVFVFYDGKLLCQKRSAAKNGLIDHSVGGHISKGESYESGTAREMREELNVSAPLAFVGRAYEDTRKLERGQQIIHWIHLFETELNDAQFASMKPDPREVEAMIPMTLEEVASQMRASPLLFTPGFLNTLNLYVKVKELPVPEIPIR